MTQLTSTPIMPFHMLRLGNYLKIRDAIIQFITIDMMDYFFFTKRPTNMFFHYKPVAIAKFSVAPLHSIATIAKSAVLRIGMTLPLPYSSDSFTKTTDGYAVHPQNVVDGRLVAFEPSSKRWAAVLNSLLVERTNFLFGFYIKLTIVVAFHRLSIPQSINTFENYRAVYNGKLYQA
jgi:hypothetical protein